MKALWRRQPSQSRVETKAGRPGLRHILSKLPLENEKPDLGLEPCIHSKGATS